MMESGEQEKRIKHYSNRHQILLVGEGDFSFALCLAKAFGLARNVTATSLLSEEELGLKHPTAAANLRELKERGSTIMHDVDVYTMSRNPRLRLKSFDRIVFNFPHAGFQRKDRDEIQIELHRDLVRNFLENARKMLDFNGEVHVTHKISYPFFLWKIEELGEEAGLRLKEESSFSLSDYPGYENKRGGENYNLSNESFPVGLASTFKFVI